MSSSTQPNQTAAKVCRVTAAAGFQNGGCGARGDGAADVGVMADTAKVLRQCRVHVPRSTAEVY